MITLAIDGTQQRHAHGGRRRCEGRRRICSLCCSASLTSRRDASCDISLAGSRSHIEPATAYDCCARQPRLLHCARYFLQMPPVTSALGSCRPLLSGADELSVCMLCHRRTRPPVARSSCRLPVPRHSASRLRRRKRPPPRCVGAVPFRRVLPVHIRIPHLDMCCCAQPCLPAVRLIRHL